MKRYDPTPSRLQRARREGDHPLSRDAIAVAAVLGAAAGIVAARGLAGDVPSAVRDALAGGSFVGLLLALSSFVVMPALGGTVGALGATFLQTRGLAVRRLSWHFSVGRVVQREALAATGRSSVALICGVCVVALASAPEPVALARVAAGILALGVAAAAVDAAAARGAWLRRLRMTHEELRRDLREQEGDPQTRGRRRRLHRLLLRGSLRQVRRASFVIVNPTHVAVAVRYAPPKTPVPEILLRAADERALRVRALAEKLGVPAIEDAPLARQLYAYDALGPIPPETYVAVAHVIAALQRRR